MTKETLKEYFKNSFIKENVIMLNVFDKLTEEEFDLFYNLFRFKLQEQAKQNISLIDNKIEKVKQRTGHNKRQKRIIINALNSIKKQMGD